MAELDSFDYEVADEELVDFEGSDYGFGSDEELGLEEEANAALSFGLEDEAQKSANVVEKVAGSEIESETRIVERNLAGFSASATPAKRKGADCGEIEDERGEKDDGVVAQVVSGLSSAAFKECVKDERKVVESRRRHRKADLEDGELDDAAMPEGSDHEAEGISDGLDEDEKDRRDRKRRKDRFFAERHSDDLDGKGSDSVIVAAARLQRNRGRELERYEGFSKAPSACGRGMQMGRFGNNPSMAPGIMGPGGPLMHIDMGPAVALRPLSRGFVGPVAGMPLPSEVSMSQLQEAMAVREQMLWSQRMIQQCAQVAGHPGRNIPGSLPDLAMRPVGLDFNGPLPRGLLHLPAQGLNLGPQVNFGEHMETPLSRVSRAGYGSHQGMPFGGGIPSQVPGRQGPSPREGNMIRQSSWPAALVQSKDVPAVGRGRALVRGHPAPVIWPNPQNIRQTCAQPQARLGQSGGGQTANVRHSGCPEMPEGGAAKMAHSPNGPMGSGNGRADAALAVRMGSDGQLQNDDRSLVVDAPNLRMNPNASNAPGSVRYRAPTQQKHTSFSQSSSRSANADWHGNVSNTSSNLINLGGPVQKSRLLTVSGLPENTSMSVVVEAFENQGKVMDFRKEERGDAFTITFASMVEAISAKRHLHRSIIAGRQITVEYAVQ